MINDKDKLSHPINKYLVRIKILRVTVIQD